MTPHPIPSSWRRKNYLINRPLQLKIIIALLLASLSATLFVGLVIYLSFLDLYRSIVPFQLHLAPEFLNFLVTVKREVLYAWIFSFVVTASLCSAITLIISHRMVGPLYALQRNLSLAIESPQGKLPFLRLRKRDEFHDLKDAFNEALVSCSEHEKKSKRALLTFKEELVAFSEKPENGALRSTLERIITSLPDLA